MDRESVPVPLSGDDVQFVSRQVKSGRYRSKQAVLQDGLRLLKEREALEDYIQRNKTAIRRKIERGAKQAERGELIDGEVLEAEIDKLDREAARRKKAPARGRARKHS